MEFKVVLNVNGEDIEMKVLFAGATVNIEFFKEGKSCHKQENLPVEILSKITEKEEESDDAPVIDLTEENEYDGYYANFFDGLLDLDQVLAEAAEDIECKMLVKKLHPICKKHYSTMETVVLNMSSAFTEHEYSMAMSSLKNGLGGLSILSSNFLKDLGNDDMKSQDSSFLFGRFTKRRERRSRQVICQIPEDDDNE